MIPLHILDMPDKCLQMVCQHLDLRTQCNFALTCKRFKRIYKIEHKKSFQCFSWFEGLNMWSYTEINAFFKLNGRKIKLMTIFAFLGEFIYKEMYMINACIYLKNLHSLIICVDFDLSEIITEICKHLKKLENLTIDNTNHTNYESLAELPRLIHLDIQHFVKSSDKVFKRLAELRPGTLKYLRIGTELTVKLGWHIAYLSGLKMFNINNPNRHFINCVVSRLSKLTVLSVTNAQQLQDNDFKQLLIHLKFLASLYVSHCMDLNNNFVLFVIQYLKQEVFSVRHLPFCLGISSTGVSNNINEIEHVKSSLTLLKINVAADLEI